MIGVFDSGVGGLNILKELTKLMPERDFIYYGDSKNCPYGEKSDSELMAITTSIVMRLKERGCKVIVIACNTATTRCIKHLREVFPGVIFVGTEPAIKPACEGDYKNILMLGTPGTCVSLRTNELIKLHKKEDQNLYLVPCYGLANAIEFDQKDIQKRIIKEIYQTYKKKNIDCVVLGCTHYPLIKELIAKYFKNVDMVDGSLGVAKRVKYLLQQDNNLNDKGSGDVIMINSLDNKI